MKDGSLFWNKAAEKYALKPVPSQERYEKKLKLTRELLRPDSTVLEVGCGTGTTSLLHAPHVAKIIGSDFSSEMIKIANDKALEQKQENVSFVCESIQDMDYPESEFDIIMAHSILHLIENRKDALEKIYKSLKPGGHFVTSTGCLGGLLTLFKPIWYIGFLLGKLPYLGWFTKSAFIKEVTNAGFVIDINWSPTKVDIFLIAKKPA